MGELRMPSLGADMEGAKLVAWQIAPGERVKRGQIVAVVETVKGAIDMECFEDGVVERLLAEPGAYLKVGEPMAVIRSEVPKTERPPAPHVEPAPMRSAIAAAVSRSKREIPHYYLATTIDLSACLDWLQKENLKRPVTARLLPAALLVKATALAAKEVPEVNGTFEQGLFTPSQAVHLGMAISLRGGGLVTPALLDAADKSLSELMAALADLVERARAGRLRSLELSAPTLTVTNLGELGVETVFGVIYPPQVALVGFGKIAQAPVVLDGKVLARPVLTASLCADHRVSDGHRGGQFLTTLERLLQGPEAL